MENLIGTNSLIEEARQNPPKRNLFMVFVTFFVVYIVGSLLSGVLLMIPEYVYIFQDEEVSTAIAAGDYDASMDAVYSALENPPAWLSSAALFATVGSIAACIFYCKKIERRRLFTLGFIKKGAVPEYLFGLLLGFSLFGAAFLIAYLTGEIEILGFNPNLSVGMLLLFFLGYLVQGMSEEVLLRGYLLVSVSTRAKTFVAVLSSSIVFALLHLGNSNVTVLAMVNLFLFGLLSALYFIRRGSIWGIAALHSMWNFTQGSIFGISVSGTSSGDSIFVTAAKEGSTLWNGGLFGLEGGLAVTVVLTIGIALLLMMKNKHIDPPLFNIGKLYTGAKENEPRFS